MRDGATVHLLAVGMEAVANAVMTTAHAAFYLESDGLRLAVQPEMEQVVQGGRDVSVVRLVLSFL
jgi:stage V sporulation protein SpoVS